jgi:hypothetical protein
VLALLDYHLLAIDNNRSVFVIHEQEQVYPGIPPIKFLVGVPDGTVL